MAPAGVRVEPHPLWRCPSPLTSLSPLQGRLQGRSPSSRPTGVHRPVWTCWPQLPFFPRPYYRLRYRASTPQALTTRERRCQRPLPQKSYPSSSLRCARLASTPLPRLGVRGWPSPTYLSGWKGLPRWRPSWPNVSPRRHPNCFALIVRCERNYQPAQWVAYDRAFRREALAGVRLWH